jgi:hypothetical protein
LPQRKSRANAPTNRLAASRTSLGGRSRVGAAGRRQAKAEWTDGAPNSRFVVTSLAQEEHQVRLLYQKLYGARGEMENRIKECQLDLYADPTSCHTMRANQLRLRFASMAYVSSVRRIKFAKPSAFPHQAEYRAAPRHAALTAATTA